MNRIGRYMEPEGGPLSWYSTMKNIKDTGDRDFYQNVGKKPGSGILDKVKGLFAKTQGGNLNPYDNIQRPGLLGYNGLGQAGFFSKVQDLFLNKKDSVQARSDWHNFRNPGEGASRPGFIHSAPQQNRPGFIAGMGAASPETGAQILDESKSALSKIGLFAIVIGLIFFLKMR